MVSCLHPNETAPPYFLRSRSIIWLVGLLLVLAVALPAAAQPLRVGIVLDGPWAGNEPLLELFKDEILALTSGEFQVRFPEDKIAIGDWSLGGVQRAADRLFNDPQVDLLLAIGVLTSQDLATRGPLPKPTVAPFTVDPEVQNYPLKETASGVANFCYLASPSPIRRDLQTFSELFPFRHLAILSHRAHLEAIPALREEIRAELGRQGIQMTSIPVDSSAAEALAALPAGIDAVYVTPLQRLPQEQFQLLVQGLKERRLPSFSYFGYNEVQRGLLAGAATASDFSRLARRTALTVQSVLLGDDPGQLPVFYSSEDRLTINMATARAIGFSPTWEQLIEADLLEQEIQNPSRTLSLAGTVEEAMQVNLDLAAFERRISAGEAEVRKAKAALLPQLAVTANGLLIDEAVPKRASALSGTFLTGWYWSNPSTRNHDGPTTRCRGSNNRPASRNNGSCSSISSRQRPPATSTCCAPRPGSHSDQQSAGHTLNLILARRRQTVGFSGPSEVYRWESQLARDRKAVISASTQRSLAEIALNRLLQRPAEESFSTSEVNLDDPQLQVFDQRMAPYLGTPAAFARYRDFMVGAGLAEVPELQRLDQAIAAGQRLHLAARRSFWAPEVSLQAGIGQHLYEGGAGVESSFSDVLPIDIPESNDTDWNVGLNLTLPLFTGGARRAELQRSSENLARLRTERQALAGRIEQRIRSALQLAQASHAGIRLSRQGASAARKNLDLVTDAYSRGLVSIIELIDAQNASLVADRVAANAVYDYFVDLMEVQRAVGPLRLLPRCGAAPGLVPASGTVLATGIDHRALRPGSFAGGNHRMKNPVRSFATFLSGQISHEDSLSIAASAALLSARLQ
ncbi:MAG: TolC family protein [Syntrophotaleaceae bacterium]